SKGISYQTLNLYLRFASKDPEGAARLAREIVEKLGSLDLVSNQEAGTVATNLISHGWMQAQAQDRQRLKGGASEGSPVRFDRENFVRLLEITANAAATLSRSSDINN